MPTRTNNSAFSNGSSITCETDNRIKMIGLNRKEGRTHLAQLAQLVAEATNLVVSNGARILVSHVVHHGVHLARKNAVVECDVLRHSVKLIQKNTNRMMVSVVMSSVTRVPGLSK